MIGSCPHAWGAWTKRVPQYDSLGNRLMFAGRPYDAVVTLNGSGRPVTPGWSRTCSLCGGVQHAMPDGAS